MNAAHQEKLARLSELREAVQRAAALFLCRHQADIDAYRRQISLGIDDILKRMRDDVEEISAANRVVVQLAEQASEYASWMQWSLWDLPVFAVALRPQFDEFRQAVAACGLVHIATRVFDDVIDRHFSYKGRHDTLLAVVSEAHPNAQKAVGLNILAGLLLCFEGLNRLSDPDRPDFSSILRSLVGSLRRALVGAIMEYTDVHEWSLADYDHLVQLKNVDVWRGLYAALDPEHASPMYAFFEKHYALAQNLNDVQDYEADLSWGQPNLLVLNRLNGRHRRGERGPVDAFPDPRVPPEVELLIGDKFLGLAGMAEGFPDLERGVALYKLSELLEAAYRLGLFAAREAEADHHPLPHPPRLFWFSELQDVIGEAGPGALVHVGCPVCDSQRRRTLFQKQGFTYHRCPDCSHVYVSPRISAEVQAQMLLADDGLPSEDKYLAVQRVYAESICHMLRQQTPGPRLLDIGFGRGYLMQMAQVYGFEVYGLDSSRVHVDRLKLQFGDRVVRCVVGREPIPWESFDVVVISHVLEHLPDPESSLKEVVGRLTPGGLLYVVVPDLGSMHFRIFGKAWDVIAPLVHLQYFNEASLSRLLTQCGLERVERIRAAQLPDEVSPRWMRLMRQLGDGDAGELAMLARLPAESPR